jgi:NAD(P)H dehydrogenase (quinone)
MGTQKQTLLVTGANGNLGRRVIELVLAKNSGNKIIAGSSRNLEALSSYAGQGVEIRKVDFEDPKTLAEAFKGVDRLLLISTKALGKQRQLQHQSAIEAARKAGVKHIIYTSMINPENASPLPFAADHLITEQTIKASGMGWTILRNSWYMDNLFEFLPPALASGKWFTSAGEGKVANVSREDCARVAVSVLLSGETVSKQYDVTGSNALTTDQIAEIASRVLNKPIQVVHISDEQLEQGLKAAGTPAYFVPVIVGLDANTRLGNVDVATDAVELLTGQNPESFENFLKTHKGVFR